MKVIITGGAGFLGQQLAAALLKNNQGLKFSQLVLADIQCPTSPIEDSRVSCVALDLTQPEAADKLIDAQTDVVFTSLRL